MKAAQKQSSGEGQRSPMPQPPQFAKVQKSEYEPSTYDSYDITRLEMRLLHRASL